MATLEVAACAIQHCDRGAAEDPAHAGTDEVWSRASKTAGNANDTYSLGYIFSFTVPDAYALGKNQAFGFTAQTDRGDRLAIANSFSTSAPSRPQTTLTEKAVHVNRAAGFYLFAP
jgi:hypothetical protein